MTVKSSEKRNAIQKAAEKLASNNSKTDNMPAVTARPIDRLKAILNAPSVQEQFKNVFEENAGAFVASIIDLYNTDATLQACDPKAVVMEALKAASLKLPINRQLGFAWIVPCKDNKSGRYNPNFWLGYKGYIQLAMRTGAYRHINVDVVYEGELVKKDKLTGEIEIDDSKRTSDRKVGYFAFIELLNGFRKTLFMTVDEVTEHARKHSSSRAWVTEFDAMALKTCLRFLLSKYGVMSVEMQKAYIEDVSADSTLYEIPTNNDDTIDLLPEPEGEAEAKEAETKEAETKEAETGKGEVS